MPVAPIRLNEFMPYRLSITSNAVSDLIAGEYRARYGLKIPEWRVMAVLGDAGSLTQRELVAATLMDKVAVNRACKVLEGRRLVTRSPNVRDGRSHHLELTEAGRTMHGRIMPLAVDMYEKVFASLTARDREKLGTILDRLLASVRGFEGAK
ncbi:MAG TPA: MarR family winged helix-turn-helix transcriptional regulator [Novosphingobium sp.]|nr:MarR family winged helix-turn-helix transcriptional regulator [Novosphingobium sp.]